MIDSKSQVAKRIKDAREWKGITQVKMAKLLAVARQTYLDIETGKTEPRVRMLSEIAEITERPFGWFVYGDADVELKDVQYKQDVNRLLEYFSKLPYEARTVILNQSVNMASFMVNYSKSSQRG
ncbi:helix-turn-helix transcriptional regulator [Candidatus Enterovibrio escicola]|uniref:Putative transcriptional regulator n=1 Tax=Candidatus Enterovibrio escicola TaxID=1927127 RepID=A0A2A5T535_9GAMM|nr:helix-turn-helix transcriptional regulator [Candidatus Enterovibrio escacola]PCS23282.1 putative transcriptional regulator [Candidatus Enterovibrio escacola]